MEKEMRELDDEGVAIHVGPESCVRVREGAGEALTGVRAGWAIEPRKLNEVRGADAVAMGGRQHRQRRYRESLWGPARSENLGTYGISMRENREVPRLLVRLGGS
jgi:RNA-directed DNA polymerase